MGYLVCMCIPNKRTTGYLRLFGLYVYSKSKDGVIFAVIWFVCVFQNKRKMGYLVLFGSYVYIKKRGVIYGYLVCMCIPNRRTGGYSRLFGLCVWFK